MRSEDAAGLLRLLGFGPHPAAHAIVLDHHVSEAMKPKTAMLDGSLGLRFPFDRRYRRILRRDALTLFALLSAVLRPATARARLAGCNILTNSSCITSCSANDACFYNALHGFLMHGLAGEKLHGWIASPGSAKVTSLR